MVSANSSFAEAQSLLQLHYLAWIAAGKYFARLACYVTYVLLYHALVYPRFFSPLRSVPGPSMGSLLFGQYFTIVKKETCIPQCEWAKHPEARQQIMVKDWLVHPHVRTLVLLICANPNLISIAAANHARLLELVAGYGLFTVAGDAHKKLRKAMNPAFPFPISWRICKSKARPPPRLAKFSSTKKDIMGVMVRARKAELNANSVSEVMSDMAMVDQRARGLRKPFFIWRKTEQQDTALNESWTGVVDRINGVHLGGRFLLEPPVFQQYLSASDEWPLWTVMRGWVAAGEIGRAL
ncbi:hypothetical protein MVEN_02185600 [Mycena venus]|uniref:Cytochrome P450 n=1 Tax=Mycena venus TaxID=2733690 RepID=A0A8H7CHC8_9AGAR|nr:hypothetical protein MVEN_02185600 [Mycena venus]